MTKGQIHAKIREALQYNAMASARFSENNFAEGRAVIQVLNDVKGSLASTAFAYCRAAILMTEEANTRFAENNFPEHNAARRLIEGILESV